MTRASFARIPTFALKKHPTVVSAARTEAVRMTDNSEPLADYDLSNVHAIVLLNHLGAPLQSG
jgi:hypothetical protein